MPSITTDQTAQLEGAAKETLDAFKTIADAAKRRLSEGVSDPGDALAVRNTFTDTEAVSNLSEMARVEREACRRLAEEPAIARVVASNDDGYLETYYIARAASQVSGSAKVASYRSQIGRLASLGPGDTLEIERASGEAVLEVLERALLKPRQDREGWEALNSVFETLEFGPITVESLRRLARGREDLQEAIDEIEQMLREEEAAAEIIQGRRRNIIERMGLRDQPVLDKFQDEIFRMPINSRLAILGAPGSGKTTTLIRRLGQKLDRGALEPNELQLIRRSAVTSAEPHERSWLMFTPTELLRGYVKEAFAREDIAAPDKRITTWEIHRREFAKSPLPILRTSAKGGMWILREQEPTLLEDTIASAQDWFEDFGAWQHQKFWDDIESAAEALSASGDERAVGLAARIEATLGKSGGDAWQIMSINEFVGEVRALLDDFRAVVATELRAALNERIREDRGFLDSLAGFIDTFASPTDEEDVDEEIDAEADADDDEDEAPPQTRRAVAIAAFNAALRRQAVAEASGRRAPRGRAAALLGWLGGRGLRPDQAKTVGRNLLAQRALRQLASPVRGYLGGVARRYRTFRRLRRGEGRWYQEDATGRIANAHEVDLMILTVLRSANTLLAEDRVRQRLDEPAFTLLKRIAEAQRNQILVDEVTDFSLLQLGCMAALANPIIGSVFVCGDFNQRITSWGLSTSEDLAWAIPGVAERTVLIAYRQSKQLYEFGRSLALLGGEQLTEAALPEDINNEGVPPTLGTGLADHGAVAAWVATRIGEIASAVEAARALPTIAVLVPEESLVQPVADALDAALADNNLRAAACLAGRMVGNEQDVRVFDVQHVKGMEFEGVLFVAIDRLAASQPDLFDRYLYVGATRAATYLGVTSEGELPSKLSSLAGQFCGDWTMAAAD